MSKGYNGWSNYETWCVNLWLGNDESSYRELSRMANAAKSVYDLAQDIKGMVEENNPLADQASMYTDLLNSAISECNWLEIAEHLWEERDEENEDEEEDEEE